MKIDFYKYHGTGNDFIMIDDRASTFLVSDQELIAQMCQRRFGIGADGLILLREHEEYDFEMIYFNADGAQSSMCGNGGRCIVAFAAMLGIVGSTCSFMAIDGLHEAAVDGDIVKIKMQDVRKVAADGFAKVLDTGSPHFVMEVQNLEVLDVKSQGSAIRYSDKYRDEGININFVQKEGDLLHVATYERGVEDETYSCGTGVVASAIAFGQGDCQMIKTKGGSLSVYYETDGEAYTNVWLSGPAKMCFKGQYLMS